MHKIVKNEEKTKNHFFEIAISFAFIFVILQISMLNGLKKDEQASLLENRNLKQKPEFSLAGIISGDFTKEYEEYISDQFIGRDLWIKLKANGELLCGKNKINNVYIGNDDYLLEDFKAESDEDIVRKVNALNAFSNKNSSLNISFMLVPTAGKVYEENLPKYSLVDDQKEFMDKIEDGLADNIKFVDVYDDLMENKDDYIYYKTDHHWTSDGAYVAYKSMCEQLDMEPSAKDEFDIETVSEDFYGSLYYKLGAGIGTKDKIKIYIPKEESEVVVDYTDKQIKSASLYKDEKLDSKDKYEVFMDGNHKLVNIKTKGDYNKRLLIVKDSYANSFIPFLTKHYGEIDVVDLRYYTDDLNSLIESDGITDVLFLYNVNTFNDDNSIMNIE
ncbi:DHHW family protein [uncultured Clostridium sp.]|uniref:DHHW family protein n=1 Tax=uncultured Clostridium sp. TaxID=59620 RepID=UPI0025D2D577|nr:DHHW family protein [uncultured Clostridium sp.]